MAEIQITPFAALPEVLLLHPTYFEDHRGYYCEVYSKRTLAQYGLTPEFVQDNHSYSAKKGTIRGIHFQNNPAPQLKLVRCTRGVVRDFAVDLRRGSPTFGKWVDTLLSEENRNQIWIPRGFGHAFVALTDDCEVLYKVDNLYEPVLDRTIAYNDPAIGIDWGVTDPILSAKDKTAPTLAESDVNFVYEK